MKKIKNLPFILFFLCYFGFWFALSFFFSIHPDSLDHWGWSKKIAWGYANNAPMIAYWMKLAGLIIDNSVFAIKWGGVLSSLLVLMSAYWAARSFLTKKETFFYLLILNATVYYSLSSQFWTFEQVYNFFWFLTLGSLGRWIKSQQKKWLFFTALFFALGFLSKYIIGLFVIIVFFWILWDKNARLLLKNSYFWLAVFFAFVLLLPHLYWNYQRDWVAFRFVLNKGIEEGFQFHNLWKIQLSHLFFYSLFFSLPAWWVLFSKQKKLFPPSVFILLFLHSIIPVIVFTYTSMKGKIADPNWMAGSYISLFLFLAKYFSFLWERKKKFLVSFSFFFSYGILIVLTIFWILFQHYQFSFISLGLQKRINESYGWEETALEVEKIFQQQNRSLPDYVITKHYQTGAAFAFYLSNSPQYYVTQKASRELVKKEVVTKNRAIVLIRSFALEDVEKIQKIFPQKWVYLGDVAAIVQGKELRKFQVWLKEKE